MTFSFTIDGKSLQPPAQQGELDEGRIEKVWGDWNGASVTTGDLILECDKVLTCNVSNKSGVEGVQVELDTDTSGAKAGSVKLTFTSGHAGKYEALILHRNY